MLGGVSGARTLLRINLFTKGKPNTFSTMDYWGGERERDEDTAQSGRREEGDSVCWVGGGGNSKKRGGGEEQKEREREISAGGRHCGDTEHPGGLGGPTGQTDGRTSWCGEGDAQTDVALGGRGR